MVVEREIEQILAAKCGGSAVLIGPPNAGKTTLLSSLIRKHSTPSIIIDGLLSTEFAVNLNFISQKLSVDKNVLHFEELANELLARQAFPFTVIVIEWLDRFLGQQQAQQQQLLYGLLELSSALPIFIIGVCRRIDVVEGMEKRVRSRFSQKLLFLPQHGAGDCRGESSGLYELSTLEVLMLTAVHRISGRGRLTMSRILQEYTALIRNETDCLLLVHNTISPSQHQSMASTAVLSERQLCRAVEGLIDKGLIVHCRGDVWVERRERTLALTIPLFILPELILASPGCPHSLASLFNKC